MFSKQGMHWYVFTAYLNTDTRRFGVVKDYLIPACYQSPSVRTLAVIFVSQLKQEVGICKARCEQKSRVLLFIVSMS